MQSRIVVFVGIFVASLSAAASVPDAQAILETAQRKQLERWAGVQTYVVEQQSLGVVSRTYFRRTELDSGSGIAHVAWVPISSGGLGKCAAIPGAGAGDLAAGYDPQAIGRYIDSARRIGTETVDGRNAYRLRIEDLGELREADGTEYEMQSMELWLDTQQYVPLRVRLEGSARSGNRSRPVTIDVGYSDFRSVPGSEMYEPFRQTVQISGALDPAQQAELQQAQAKMEELENRLAEMPPGQRAAMERMMGPQLQTLKSMAAGDGIRVELVTRSIEINPSLENAQERPCPEIGNALKIAMGAAAGPSATGAIAKPDTASMRTAQEECLQQKVDQAQQRAKRKRGFRRLVNVAHRAAGRFGKSKLRRVTQDVYDVDATAADLSTAARELGLTDEDVAACRDPR